VGPGASVGILNTGYSHVQALSQDKEHGVHPRAATYAVASDHTSLHKRWALPPPRVPRPQTSPPWRGELRSCHVSRCPRPRLLAEVSSGAATFSLPGPCLLAEVSSGATTCPIAPGSTSLRGELRCCHVSHGSVLCFPERGAPVLSRVARPPAGCELQE
jgi:hypothetical protein